MPDFLVAGPFDARDGEGRVLFEDQGLRLAEGRATVLDGPSGSGKSTLLRLVAALVASGRDVQRRLDGETYEGAHLVTWRSRVTLMAQDAPMIPGSVRDNLEFPFRLRCSGKALFDEKAAAEGLRLVGLGRLPFDRNVDTLSGGERHRLALARGLLWDPPVLLADEPLSGLDADTATSCLELLLTFGRRPGHALLIVLHHRELAARADAVIQLAGGTTGIG